ncbi:MAG: 3-deoxy-D-manno-octulosonic acid transferase [Candidatus Omnitrophota bacterium]
MLYDIAFFIFAVFYLPALIFRGKFHGDFRERFGVYDAQKARRLGSGRDRIWIHAVSVGEVSVCKALIPALRSAFPGNGIVISTITRAGNKAALKAFSGDAIILYLPLDFRSTVRRSLDLIRPRLFIMVETEIWPNLLLELHRRSIPSVLVNGRISDRSFGKYRLGRAFLKGIVEKIKMLCMQSRLDAERISALGAPEDKVLVTGNMKFDMVSAGKETPAGDIRTLLGLGDGSMLFVAGSTHEGEEEAVTEVFKDLLRNFPDLRLLIAPRHIERTPSIEAVIKRFGFDTVRVSSLLNSQHSQLPTPDSRLVYLLDTIGDLRDIYSVAGIVFVGGSLVRHGGQNPIEPALFGKPVIFGPHMFNFRDVASAFLREKAALQVADKDDLLRQCGFLLRNKAEISRLGDKAKEVILANRGATDKNLDVIRALVGRFKQDIL